MVLNSKTKTLLKVSLSTINFKITKQAILPALSKYHLNRGY